VPRAERLATVRERIATMNRTEVRGARGNPWKDSLLTTESSMEKKMEGKKAGATGWIVKPFNPAQLLATLTRVL
jgi:two-component system chemotaxis response regulator CheY